MPVPAPTTGVLTNAGFETGDTTGWTLVQTGGSGTPSVTTVRAYNGLYCGKWVGASGSGHGGGVECEWFNDNEVPVTAGKVINAKMFFAFDDTGSSQNQCMSRIYWYDAAHGLLGFTSGTLIHGNNEAWALSTVGGAAPANAAFAKFGAWTTANSSGAVLLDFASWDYVYNQAATLLLPVDGATYQETATIPVAISITGTTPTATSVTYFVDDVAIITLNAAPFNYNLTNQTVGDHEIYGHVLFSDDTYIDTTVHTFTVSGTPPVVIKREFKASNSYGELVTSNFAGLSLAIPATAKITAVEFDIDYRIRTLTRAKDIGVEDPAVANSNVIFDITDGGVLEAIMLSTSGDGYTTTGTPVTAAIPLDRPDFDEVEHGTSEGKGWMVLDSEPASITLGSDTSLFGATPIAAADFIERSFGFRFYPVLLAKPAYADTGDACIRFLIDKLRIRVYFDAGSVDYYFASPDKTDIIHGQLVSANVTDGDFTTGDAVGVLQLTSELEVMDGGQEWIGDDWTIHAAYPPTDANQIGTVSVSAEFGGNGMSYNGLPTQSDIIHNRSRYQFITANFYGDSALNSIYGAHGLPRAFAYNGEFFYKIYTQPDPTKDSPRHVAYHHSHLALGFDEGRVDISVVGKPYSFDGLFGASSWTIGDPITGLLPLSGTILGVFGSKSIWGISGTTVDNFSTQVITPNIGATEYTVTDMGFPVYANAYGIYTLSQTEQYGDYLGTPMSQDVSPWLRPRLIRSATSNKEVVVAWPVRSKNQYRLAFSDGYVQSMTVNFGQQSSPTFSRQKYFITDGWDNVDDVGFYDYPSIYAIAVSSQLDDTGEERIHIANKGILQDKPIPVGGG